MNSLGICMEGLRKTMKSISEESTSQIYRYNIQFDYAVLQYL
jgi:hypothetical protein